MLGSHALNVSDFFSIIWVGQARELGCVSTRPSAPSLVAEYGLRTTKRAVLTLIFFNIVNIINYDTETNSHGNFWINITITNIVPYVMPRHARSCTTDSAFAESPKKWMRTNTPDPQYHNPYTSHQTINIIKLEGILFRNDIKKELWDCLKESLWDGEDLLQEGNILPSVLSRFSDTKGMKMDMQNLMTQLNVWVHSDDGDDLMSLEAFLGELLPGSSLFFTWSHSSL